jgi:hypothetical protein
MLPHPVHLSRGMLLITTRRTAVPSEDPDDPVALLMRSPDSHGVETQIAAMTTPRLLPDAFKAAGRLPGERAWARIPAWNVA